MADEILPLEDLIRELKEFDDVEREMDWVTNTVTAEEAERLGQSWDLYDAPAGVHTTFAQAGVPVDGPEWATITATQQDMVATGNLTGMSGPAGALLKPRTPQVGQLQTVLPGRPDLFGGFTGLNEQENADIRDFARNYVQQNPDVREEDIYFAIESGAVAVNEIIASPRFGATKQAAPDPGIVGTVTGGIGTGIGAVAGGAGWLGDRVMPDPVGRFLRDNPVTDNALEPTARALSRGVGLSVDNVVKPATNIGFRVLNYPYEMTQAMIGQTIENVRNEGFFGAVDNTLRPDLLVRDLSEAQLTTQLGALGQDVVEELGGPWAREDLQVGEGVDFGEGFFPGGENQMAFTRRAEEQFRPKIDGSAATLGRWIAQPLDPDSNWHQFVSGTVDAILAVKGPGERLMENAFRQAALGPARALTTRDYGLRVIDHLAKATTDDAIRELVPFSDDALRGALREADTAGDVRAVFNNLDEIGSAPGAVDLDRWIPATGLGARATQAAYWLTNTHLTPTVDIEAVAKLTTAEDAVPYFNRLAETASTRVIDNMTGGALPFSRLRELADATTAEAARLIIRDELGVSMKRIPRGSGAGWDAIRDRAPTITRLAHQMPDGNFSVGDGRQFLTDVEDWLVNSKASSDTLDRWHNLVSRTVGPADREDLLERLMRETGIRAALGDEFDSVGRSIRARGGVSSMRPQLEEWVALNPGKGLDVDDLWSKAVSGVETGFTPLDELVQTADEFYGQMSRMWKDTVDDARYYDIDRATGDRLNVWVSNGGDIGKAEAEPQLLSEHLSRNVPMPDVRQFRAEFSRFRNIMLQQTRGQLRVPSMMYYGLLSAQSKFWKPSVLLRIAWPVRVVGEEQMRLAASGLPSAFTHPWQHMTVALGSPGRGKVGSRIGRYTGDAMEESFAVMDEFADAMASRVDNFYTGTHGASRRSFRGWQVIETGTTTNGVRRVNMGQWDETAQAWADDIARLRHDRVAGPVSRRTADEAKEWFWNEQEELRQILRRSHPESQMNVLTREGSDAYIDSVVRRLDDVTRGSEELMGAIRTGRLGDVSMSNTTSASINKDFISKLGDYTDYVPEFLPARKTVPLGWLETGGRWDRLVERMFGALMGTPTDRLSRSPVFRQEYWSEVNALAGRMDQQYADQLIDAAVAANLPNNQVRQIRAFAGKPGRGIPTDAVGQLSLEDIDMLAKAHALERTQTLLFDLSKRNQFFDINALLIPFGDAWGEVISRWMMLVRDNPQVIRRGMQAIQAGRDTGIVQKNEYGEEEFIYPFSEQIMQGAGFVNPIGGLTPGVPVKLTGQLSGLSLMTNVFPGVGVVGQFAVAAILPSQSNYDWLRDVLLPYGDPTSGNLLDIASAEFVPSWFRKVLTGVADEAATPQGERSYLSVFGSVFAHLGSTGEYDVDSEVPGRSADEWTRLVLDARAKAAESMLNLGIAQNISPSTPYFDWEIEQPNGDMIRISALSKLYSEKFEEGSENPIGEFLEEYGPWALMSVQGRTINTLPGRIPPTAEADAWFRDNPEFASTYPIIAHFFAPQEGEFDINAYSNILDRETSVPLSEAQRVTRFLDTMGQQAYMRKLEEIEQRATREYPNYEEGKTLPAPLRRFMADYDEYLVGLYSFSDGGYAGRGANPAGLPERTVIKDRGSAAVVQLRRAVEDPAVAFDSVAVATREMFDAFESADEMFREDYSDLRDSLTSWETSVKTPAIRRYIVDYADYLMGRTPEFRTIYEEMFLPMIDAGLIKDEQGEN